MKNTSRLILQVRWGPQSFRKASLLPGETLRVGREEAAGMRIAWDELMSPLHFELEWDGRSCRLRDLKSALGTWLDGQPVQEAEVPHGGWLRAGRTDFSVYHEEATPPPPVEDSAELAAAKEHALSLLLQQEAPLFAVLDAARDERILVLLRESIEECRSLYEGPQGDAMEEVAPYLVRLPKGSKLLSSLVREGWSQSWGVYLTCALPFVEVRRHLRKFLRVRAEGIEGPLYFRYYDPRVLKTFLATSTQDQRREFLGPLAGFILEAGEGAELRHYDAA